jgi:hypothetical protein
MKRALKTVGLLVLGAVLGQVALTGLAILGLVQKLKNPGFLASTTMLGAAPRVMSNEELSIWNDMRDKIRRQQYAEVKELIRITERDVDFDVVPAKPVFAPGDCILAEIRIRNISGRTLHLNEPREMKLTPESYYYQGRNQFDYDLKIDPFESTWMRTLQPGEKLSLPTLILTTNAGPHKINYSLSVFELDQKPEGNSIGNAPVVKRASCNFTVQPRADSQR